MTTVDDKKNVLIFSAIDGHKLAQLNTEPFPNFSQIEYVVASPSGKRIATVNPFESFQIWNTDSWTAMTEKKQIPADRFIMDTPTLRFISDDLISLNSPYFTLLYQSWQAEVLKEFPFLGATVLSDRAVVGDGQIYDTRNWERAYPPAGRKYHPDIGRFAFDGRFVFCLIDYHHDLIIDTQTEKHLPVRHDWYSTFGHLPSFGFVKAKHNYGVNIRIVPTAQLDVPSALLQLWAQVAVRGELGRDGEFVKWDEQTWERKRQELAAMPTPWPAFPFPGYVATDRLHWLRQEYENASDAEKPALAQKLLGRAEAANDNTEAIRWHAAARHTSGENVRQ